MLLDACRMTVFIKGRLVMGFYISLIVRIIVIPVILFVIFRDKLSDPIWCINVLLLPIMWSVFWIFCDYPQLTLICAVVGIIILLALLIIWSWSAKHRSKASEILILINLFEIIAVYFPSAFCERICFWSIELFGK